MVTAQPPIDLSVLTWRCTCGWEKDGPTAAILDGHVRGMKRAHPEEEEDHKPLGGYAGEERVLPWRSNSNATMKDLRDMREAADQPANVRTEDDKGWTESGDGAPPSRPAQRDREQEQKKKKGAVTKQPGAAEGSNGLIRGQTRSIAFDIPVEVLLRYQFLREGYIKKYGVWPYTLPTAINQVFDVAMRDHAEEWGVREVVVPGLTNEVVERMIDDALASRGIYDLEQWRDLLRENGEADGRHDAAGDGSAEPGGGAADPPEEIDPDLAGFTGL